MLPSQHLLVHMSVALHQLAHACVNGGLANGHESMLDIAQTAPGHHTRQKLGDKFPKALQERMHHRQLKSRQNSAW